MKFTVDLPSDLLRDVVRLTGARTPGEGAEIAIRDFVHKRQVAELVATFGTWDMLDNDQVEGIPASSPF